MELNDQECRSVLLAGSASINQRGTHQSALIPLAADYTGGIGLATLIRGVSVVGVHLCSESNAALMLLASMTEKIEGPGSPVCMEDARFLMKW